MESFLKITKGLKRRIVEGTLDLRLDVVLEANILLNLVIDIF